jgi:hypothetical protein
VDALPLVVEMAAEKVVGAKDVVELVLLYLGDSVAFNGKVDPEMGTSGFLLSERRLRVAVEDAAVLNPDIVASPIPCSMCTATRSVAVDSGPADAFTISMAAAASRSSTPIL